MVFKKLFPKNKKSEKVETQARLKTTIHHLAIKNKEFARKSQEARLRAMKALKTGNKDISRQMLIRWKTYRLKSEKYFNMIGKLERHMDALDEAKTISDVTGSLEASSSELSKIAVNVNPEKTMELVDSAEESIMQIEEAGDLLAGDLEIDLGIDVEDELNKLETELLMSEASGMPTVPEGVPESFDFDFDDAEPEIKSKDKIKKEI
ncbi:MAG: Snf7 family protein, partial [Candidatus Hodarchaeales archaeon]